VNFSGPTLFEPLIKQAILEAEASKKQNSKKFVILVILTDGDIHDMKAVIN